MLAVRTEVRPDALGGDDQGIFLETPTLRFLVTGKELQTRRVDDREVDLRLRGGSLRGRLLRAAAAGRYEEERQD